MSESPHLSSAPQAQPAILREGAQAGISIEWQLCGDPASAWAALAEVQADATVIGLGQPLVEAVGAHCPGLRAFRRIAGLATFPATQAALWALVTADTPDLAFDVASAWIDRLDGLFRVAELTPMLRYHDGRDLTGYVDGTENPQQAAARAAALIAEGPLAGGSFALVQRFLHFRRRFLRQPAAARDDIIGRRASDDEELEQAPASAHVKRTAQESFEPPAFMVRRSMPWGDPQRHGLQFIAFVRELDGSERMLARMAGLEDGVADALLGHSQAETGAWYYCPPLDGGRLRLPARTGAIAGTDDAQPATGATAARAPAANRLQLLDNGPLVLEGDLRIGTAARERNASLCRCGHSADRPWCDGSHLRVDFRAGSRAAAPFGTASADACSEALHIRCLRDGPLALEGAVQVADGDGRILAVARDPVLCRCGHSASKPWCDGSHAGARFRADAD